MEDKDKPKKKEKQYPQKEMKQKNQRLQGFNKKTLPRSKTLEKNKNGSFVLASSSASVSSMEGPKGCFIKPTPSLQSKQPYNFLRKPKSLPENSCPKKSLAAKSKSVAAPKSSSVMSGNKPLLLQPGKKPTSKASQRWKVSAGLSHPLKNPTSGSKRDENVVGEVSDSFSFSTTDNLVGFENCTPVGKLLGVSSLNCANVDDKYTTVGEDSNSGNTTVKTTTPPVEASVSPEIQSGSYVGAVATSTVTPICYGTGHLISGVTDKRKCRSRGVLTVRNDSLGLGKINSCEDNVNGNADNVLFKSRTSLIPLPVEASVNWSSSPTSKEVELQKSDFSDSYSPLGLGSIDISSSISSLCQLSSDLMSDSEKHGYENSDAMTSTGKTRILSGCQELLEFSSGERDLDFSATPEAKYIGGTTYLSGGGSWHDLTGKKSPASVDVLGCRSIVRTLSSNTSSENQIHISWRDTQGNEFDLYQDAAGQDSQIASSSPKCQISRWHPPVSSHHLSHSASLSDSIDIIRFGKESDACASWISDSTLENTSLSHMRISWRERSASQTFDMDEFDCCICLSDEEHFDERLDEVHHKPSVAFGIGKDDLTKIEGVRSPEFLGQEPEFLRKGRSILSPGGSNVCAESISTDASGLMASRDSDWSLCDKNHLFQV